MAIFQFFKMAAVRHLGFSKVGNFNFRSHSEAQYASPYQISRRSVEPFRRYGRFSMFQDGGRRHLGFWKFKIFNSWDAQESRTASACQILSKSLEPRLRYGDFSRWRPLSSSVTLPAGRRAGRMGGRAAHTPRRASTVTSRKRDTLFYLETHVSDIKCLRIINT